LNRVSQELLPHHRSLQLFRRLETKGFAKGETKAEVQGRWNERWERGSPDESEIKRKDQRGRGAVFTCPGKEGQKTDKKKKETSTATARRKRPVRIMVTPI